MMSRKFADETIQFCVADDNYRIFYVTDDGKAYRSGPDESGIIRYKPDSYDYQEPQLLTTLKDEVVVQVALADKVALFLTVSGAVYTCGLVESSLLGYQVDSKGVYQPRKVAALDDYKIVQISVKNDHVAYLTEEGEVFIAGQGGLSFEPYRRKTQIKPALVQELDKEAIVQVVAGYDCFAFLSVLGKVYTCGFGSDSSTLGHGNAKPQPTPKMIESLNEHPIEYIYIFDKSKHHFGDVEKRIFIFIAKDRKVLCCGDESVDAYGLGNKKIQRTPKIVAALEDKKIIKVIQGEDQVFYITDDGQVYTGRLVGSHQPRHIIALKEAHIVDISVHGAGSIYVTREGHVFASQINASIFGMSSSRYISEPELIESLLLYKIKQAHLFSSSCLFITDSGEVLASGKDCHKIACLERGAALLPTAINKPANQLDQEDMYRIGDWQLI